MDAGARALGKLVARIAKATKGLDDAARIRRAIDAALPDEALEDFAAVVEEQLMRGAMLGALDSLYERESEEPVPLEAFTARYGGPVLFEKKEREETVTRMPFEAALEDFGSRFVLPREIFDQLSGAARRRAFTVAGLARQELLEETRDELLRQLRDGSAGGLGPDLRSFHRFVRERLESAGWTPANPTHVEAIFRTNVMSAYSGGRHEEMRQPEVMRLRPYWQIRTVKDARQRRTHRAADGVVLRADHPFWRRAYPPFGFNCFLPEQSVAGDFRGASRAQYQGKAVELTTAEGRRLTVTANHPVLTPTGFRPAAQLRVGDHLICDGREPGVEALRPSTQRDEEQPPASAEEVFRALADAAVPVLTHAAPDDFHGEAERFVGQIEVVGSYGDLARHREAADRQEIGDFGLEAADTSRAAGSQLGIGGRAPLATPHGSPGGGALPLSGGAVPPAPLEAFGIRLTTKLDAVLSQDPAEGTPRDAELIAEALERSAVDVVTDELVFIREFDWTGHVYDFETSSGLVVAGGVVTSNCRCRVISRSQAWVDRHGGGDQPPRDLPDPGFDSGTSQVLGPTDSPEQLPARSGGAGQPPAPPAPAAAPPPPPRRDLVDIEPGPEPNEPDGDDNFRAIGIADDDIAYLDRARQEFRRIVGRDLKPSDVQKVLGLTDAFPGQRVKLSVFPGSAGSVRFEGKAWVGNRVAARTIRTLTRHGQRVVMHNDYFVIQPAFRGGGTGRRALRAQLGRYLDMGVSKVELDAAWDGQYVWPRAGYVAPRRLVARVAGEFREWLRRERPRIPADVADRMADVSSLHDLATVRYGPEVEGQPDADKLGKQFLRWRGNESGRELLSMSLDLREGSAALKNHKEYLGVR